MFRGFPGTHAVFKGFLVRGFLGTHTARCSELIPATDKHRVVQLARSIHGCYVSNRTDQLGIFVSSIRDPSLINAGSLSNQLGIPVYSMIGPYLINAGSLSNQYGISYLITDKSFNRAELEKAQHERFESGRIAEQRLREQADALAMAHHLLHTQVCTAPHLAHPCVHCPHARQKNAPARSG